MNPEDELLFDSKPPKAKFQGGRVDAATRKRNSEAVESMDMAELIGSGDTTSAGTGLHFASAPPAAEPTPAEEPTPAAAPEPTVARSAPQPKATARPIAAAQPKATAPPEVARRPTTPRVLPPKAKPPKRGLFAWLMRLFGRG